MQANESTAFAYNAAVHFSDPNGDLLTCSATGLPAGISINTATCVVSGTLPAVAADTPYSVTITAADPSSATTSRTFTLTVNNDVVITTAVANLDLTTATDT